MLKIAGGGGMRKKKLKNNIHGNDSLIRNRNYTVNRTEDAGGNYKID